MPVNTCAVMQPTYIPWLGYFDLMDQVDIFVYLDDVKLEKQSWQVRNRIKSGNKEMMLTIPVLSINGMETKINEAQLDDRSNWRKKHLKTVKQSYSKAAYQKEIIEIFTELLQRDTNLLADITIGIIELFREKLGITTETIRSCQLKVTDHHKDERVVDICRQLECSRYVSPVGSKEYIDQHNKGGAFVDSGVDLYYMNYEHPVYEQLGETFLPNMSILDLLLNCGFEQGLAIIRRGHKEAVYYNK